MKKKGLYQLLWLIGLFGITTLQAQKLPPRQPEQDMTGAITLCDNRFYTPYYYTGYGRVYDQNRWEMATDDELATGNCKCMCHGETNSVWFKLEVATPGNIVFTITPVHLGDDYDFTVWDFNNTTHPPNSLAGYIDRRLRCNANQFAGSNGVVGLNYTATDTYVRSGTVGSSFLKYIEAKAGDVYYLGVDNADVSISDQSAGFTIDFTGSTATFKSSGPPHLASTVEDCGVNADSVVLRLDKPVKVSSIAADGSDFRITPSVGNFRIATYRGTGADAYATEICFYFDSRLPGGQQYSIQTVTGTDGNTLIGLCGDPTPAGESVSFTTGNPLSITVPEEILTCITNKTTKLKVDVTGGYNNSIRWAPDLNLDNIGLAEPTTTTRRDEVYFVTVTPDNKDQCAVKDQIQVKVATGFNLLNKDTLICDGDSVVMRASGDNRFSYQWSPLTGLSGDLLFRVTAKPEQTTTYVLTASLPGCKDSVRAVKVTVGEQPVISIGADTAICYSGGLPLKPVVSPGNYPNYSYSWTPAAAFAQPNLAHPLFIADAGTQVQLIVKTQEGCADTATRMISVSKKPVVEAGADVVKEAAQEVRLQGSVNDSSATYLWMPAIGLSNPDILQPVAKPVADQLYYLTASSGVCTAYDSVMVRIYYNIEVPNAFTPNGDGVHDTWVIANLQKYQQATVDVFDRWGRLVYHATANSRAWDGAINGQPLPAGVYYYVIQPRANRYDKITGSLTILR